MVCGQSNKIKIKIYNLKFESKSLGIEPVSLKFMQKPNWSLTLSLNKSIHRPVTDHF